ncbi:hypothetical protein F5Y10DRAFT_259314 [Nemania abortiva]|nr:hypothetical protein F5Y10DRAFT_259314 [Nemania abortiva]
MDPFSTLSAAADIVGLVQFAGKIVKRAFEVRSSIKGQPAEVVDLAACSSDLSSAAITAQNMIHALSSSYPRHAESIKRLSTECIKVELKVKTALHKLTADPTGNRKSKTSSTWVAIQSMWSEREFEEWHNQLDRIRDQVQMNVLMCVLDEARKTGDHTDHILQTIGRLEVTIEAMKRDFEIIGRGDFPNPAGQEKMAEAIWESTALIDLATGSKASLTARTPSPGIPTSGTSTPSTDIPVISDGPATEPKAFAQKILESLYIEGMDYRESLVKPAFPQTFDWLFDGAKGNEEEQQQQQQQGEKPEAPFRRWLESQEKSIFWITGVPASGKSTLMKFITSHPSLSDRLRDWAGRNTLHIAKFFFWIPGSGAQKSRAGLLRSLLYQLLNQRQELVEAVAPRRRLFLEIARKGLSPPEWDWGELTECMLRLAALMHTNNSRVALFIDGLDEYEGFLETDPKTHQNTNEMVNFLITLNHDYGVKLCVSSRPLNYFRDKFHDYPSLAMEKFTQPDIDRYVEVRLGESQAIRELHYFMPQQVTDMIRELKTKARGVFLWVVLVVEQLILTSADDPRMEAIQEVLESLPEDLDKLYDSIQKQIGPEKECTSSRLYQVVMAWKEHWSGQMDATLLWLAEGQYMTQKEYPQPDKAAHIAQLTKRLLEGHTRGILQVSYPQSASGPCMVDFLHRTTYEWLRERRNWEQVLKKGPPNYEPILPILEALISYVRSLGTDAKPEVLCQHIRQIFMLASNVRGTQDTRAQLVSIIDKLDSGCLTSLGPEIIFDGTAVPSRDRSVKRDTITWAAAWACHPYIRGRVEADANLKWKTTIRFLDLFKKGLPNNIAIIEIAIFGFRYEGSHVYEGWETSGALYLFRRLFPRKKAGAWCGFLGAGARSDRYIPTWLACQRLEAIKLLLERGAKIEGYMREMIKKYIERQGCDKTTAVYLNLLLHIAEQHDTLGSIDSMRDNVFPENVVQESYDASLFQEHSIHDI